MEQERKETEEVKSDKAKSLLGVTMLAIGKIIEPNKTETTFDVEIEADGDPQDDLLADLGISFGDLPDLDVIEES